MFLDIYRPVNATVVSAKAISDLDYSFARSRSIQNGVTSDKWLLVTTLVASWLRITSIIQRLSYLIASHAISARAHVRVREGAHKLL